MSEQKSANEILKINKIASVYHSEELAGVNEKYHLYLRDAVIPNNRGRSALEIGCGKGLWTSKLAEKYDRLDVVDGSAELLNRVCEENKHKTKMSVHLSLAEDFFLESKQLWQHIYMTFLLEHVEDPVSIVKMAYDHLEVDGILFIAVPNANSVHRILALRAGLIKSVDELSESDKSVGHRRVYSRGLLLSQINKAGFRKVELTPVGLKPLTLGQLHSLPPSVIDALCASADLTVESSAYLTLKAYKS